jgi:hypothetical protein
MGDEMFKVTIEKTGLQYFDVFEWLFKNCSGFWKTNNDEDLFEKTNEEWKVYIEEKVKPNRNRRSDNNILTGGFMFENPQDALFFKLKWC